MTIKPKNELLLLTGLVVLLILIITVFPSSILRVIVGLPFLLFFPGYTLTATLFPKISNLTGIERVALSFGLSVVVVPLIGLFLNFTPWGIRLYPMLISVAAFILSTSAISWYRRCKLADVERFAVSFNLSLSSWRGQNTVDKVLSIVLVLAVLGAIGIVGQTLTKPKTGEDLTEFYILDIEGSAANYPKQLVVGQEGKVILVIANSEHQIMNYRVEVMINKVVNNDIRKITLEHDEKWEQVVSFTPQKAGEEQRVEFVLYREGEVDPWLDPLNLWIDVGEVGE